MAMDNRTALARRLSVMAVAFVAVFGFVALVIRTSLGIWSQTG